MRERMTATLSDCIVPADLAAAIAALGPEPRRCLVCSGTRFERLFRRDGKWFWLCEDCELVFVHDIYPEFVEDTGHLARTYALDRHAAAGPKKLAKYERFLRLVEPARRTGRLLEIGCGQGLFLEHARLRGWTVQGVEILAPVAALARERGLDVVNGTLEEACLPPHAFDAVAMREVIEHVVDPVTLLAEAHRVLRPGGVVAIATGNARSWAARLRGRRWAYYRFGGHMHIRFFSPRSATALARAAGFAGVECHTRGFAFLEAEEMRGHWYRPLLKAAQAPASVLASLAGAGHRLVILLRKDQAVAPGLPASPSS